MKSHPSVFLSLAAALAVWVASSPTWAGPGAKLAFEATEDCGGASGFVAAVEARGGHFAPATSAEATMHVAIHRDERDFVGTLRVHGAPDASIPREVRGTTCAEVVDALAVVAAIALDPEAKASPSSGDGARPRFNGRSRWSYETLEVPGGALRFDPLLAWTFSYGVVAGPVPSLVMPSLGLSFHMADFVTTPDGRQRVAGPIVWGRLALSAPPEANHRSSDATTSVSAQSVALGVCWSPWYDTRGLVLLGCLESGVTLMGLVTNASDGSRIQSKTSGFGTVGPLIDLEYNIGSWLHLAGKVGMNGVMGKVTAERADGSELFHSRSWAVYGDVGLGFHF